MIYFIQEAETGNIKIGSSAHPEERVSSLQIGNPRLLILLGALQVAAYDSDTTMERFLHERFKDICIRGEWFHPTQELLAAIDGLLSGKSVTQVFQVMPVVRERGATLGILPAALRRKYAEAAAAENMERLLHGN